MTVEDSNREGKLLLTSEDPDKFSNSDRNITIKKAKVKDGLFLDAEYTEELVGHGTKTTKLSCTVPVHDDLKEAFIKLHTHLAFLCDEVSIESSEVEVETLSLPGFGARSFTIGGTGDNEGVVISGYKEGEYGIVNLNTPFLKYDNDNYPFTSELSAAIDMCIYEVKQYLFHGKKAPDQQLELEFETQEITDPEFEGE